MHFSKCKKDVRFVISVVVSALVIVSFNTLKVNAIDKPSDLNSHGRIVFDNGTEDTSDDVIFDAEDLYYLYEICK